MTAGRTLAPHHAAGSATVTGVLAMADLRNGDLVAERFRIVRLLGMGGMGVVYQAHDIELDVDVALKLLRPELASRPDAFERFRQELLLARQVSSPHVVRIHDLVRHGEVWLISMDFVPGQSLERLLDTKGHLPPEEAIGIVRQLALGLAAAHQRGVIHRDLKPANVLISETGEARITDFGVARSAGSTGITVSGVIIGTPEYLSPEQARADPVDGRSDLYALGLIFFEMLTGTLPFRGGTPAEMLAQRIVRDPPTPDTIKSDLPGFAVRLCARLLELKPTRRFQTAEDVVRAIDVRRVQRKLNPRGLALALAVVAVVLGAGIVAQRRMTAPETQQVVSSTLDIAAMPLVLTGGNNADANLAAGIRQYTEASLAHVPDLHTPDSRRVDRTLTELGYDAEATRRQRARVAETLGARLLLEIDLEKDAAGLYTARYSIRTPDDPNPAWTETSAASAETDLPAALLRLQQNLERSLGMARPDTAPWPDANVLHLVGQLYHQPEAAKLSLDSFRAAARQTHDPVLWWTLLEFTDRNRSTTDTASVAREASDTFPAAPGLPADVRRIQAYAQLVLGNHESAQKELAALASADPSDHVVRLLLARAESEAGNLEQACKTLEALTREDPRNVDAWFALGMYSIMKGDSKRAVDDYLTQAMIKANRLGDERMQANVTNALGVGYQNVGQLTFAAENIESAIRLRKKLGDEQGQAGSLRNLATIRALQGDFKSAEASLKAARVLVDKTGDPKAIADLVNDVGVFEEERGEFRKALEAYREALNFRQTLHDPRLTGQSLVNVGYAYYQVGEFDNAQTYWQQAATTYAGIQDQVGLVHARQSAALAQMARGDFTAARAALDESLHDAEQLQMAEEQSTSLSSLAELDNLEGSIASALERSRRAAGIFAKRDDTRGAVEMKQLQSAIQHNAGDFDQAEAALGDLSADNVDNREQSAILLWRRGEIALGRGNVAEALGKATEAVAAAQSAHSYGTELSARLLRARVLHAQKKSKEAAMELGTARAGLEKYASVPLRLQLAETALQVNGAVALPDYRAARAELARLPSYVRAFEIHALGAAAAGKQSDTSRSEAMRAAQSAYAALLKNTPPAQQPALAKLTGTYGLEMVASHE